MRKTFIATIALAAMWSVPAMAADMPVKAPPSPPDPVQTWTGFYVGVSGGMIWDRIYGRFLRFPAPIWTTSQSTGTVDAHVGAQYQLGNVVLGVEGDYVDVSHDKNNLSFDGCEPFANCNGTFFNGRIRDMWTAGGRAGWSMGNWLPYVNGGWASARGELGFPGGFPVATIMTTPATFHGGYIGAGSDWRVWQNLILGFEYRHYQFGAGTTLPINPISLKPQVDTVSLRLSLLFNGAMFSK